MDIDQVITVIMLILPWIVAVGFSIYSFYLKYNRLPQTESEWKEAFSNVKELKDKAENLLSQVKSFFNPEAPMSETSIETIREVIPACSYQMSDESQERVLSYCASEEEKQRVLNEIFDWENPTKTGEECCIYTLETTGATFKVQYGVPEIVTLKIPEVKHLSQTQCYEITQLLSKNDQFKTMWIIMKNEIEGVDEYELSDGETKVLVKNGEYAIYKELE